MVLPIGAFLEWLTGSLIPRRAAGECLPALHDHIDVSWVELETTANPAGHFGGDQARSRAEKRVIVYLTGPAIVGDWATHAFDRFLGAVPPALLTLSIAKRVVVGDLPDRRLPAVALPMTGLTFAHCIPAGFVPSDNHRGSA